MNHSFFTFHKDVLLEFQSCFLPWLQFALEVTSLWTIMSQTAWLLQGKCANWHYYTWSQPSFYQKLKITPWTKKTTVKKTKQWISLSPLLSALLNHPWDLSSRGQKDPRPAIFKCYRHHPVIHDQCIWTPQKMTTITLVNIFGKITLNLHEDAGTNPGKILLAGKKTEP